MSNISSFHREQMRRLSVIGYHTDVPLRPLVWDAAYSVVGYHIASSATPDSPIDLGEAELVALGEKRHSEVVVRVGREDFSGSLLHDIFFAGAEVAASVAVKNQAVHVCSPRVGMKGHLFFAHNYYVLCVGSCTIGQVISIMRQIPIARQT